MTKTIDINEQIANDLEKAQSERFQESDQTPEFWTDLERAIFERIQRFRYLSVTYAANNRRVY